jgi:hypothetical protein
MSFVPGLSSQLRAVGEQYVREQQKRVPAGPNQPDVIPARSHELGRGDMVICDGIISFTPQRDGSEHTHRSDTVAVTSRAHGALTIALDTGSNVLSVEVAARHGKRPRRVLQRNGIHIAD